jgi:hypothetical protein
VHGLRGLGIIQNVSDSEGERERLGEGRIERGRGREREREREEGGRKRGREREGGREIVCYFSYVNEWKESVSQDVSNADHFCLCFYGYE